MRPTSVAVDASGNSVVAGCFGGTVEFDPGLMRTTSAGGHDAFLARYDATGAFVSVLTLGSAGGASVTLPVDCILDVAFDASGNAVVTGVFTGTTDFDPGPGVVSRTAVASNADDVFLARYTPEGALLSLVTFGSYGYDYVSDVELDASGNAVVTGVFFDTVDFDPGPELVSRTAITSSSSIYNSYVARYDAGGAFVSVITVPGHQFRYLPEIEIDATGNTVVTGKFSGTVDFDPGLGVVNRTSAAFDLYVARYTSDGALVTLAIIDSGQDDDVHDVALDASGNAVVTGVFYDTVDFDPGPSVVSRMPAGDIAVFVARYDATGTLLSIVTFGGTGDSIGYGVVVDASGNAVVTGDFTGTVDFDPGVGVVRHTSPAGTKTFFVARYDAAGALLSVFTFGPAVGYYGLRVALDARGNSVVAGVFRGTTDFDPGPGTESRTTEGQQGSEAPALFVARYTPDGVLVDGTSTSAEEAAALGSANVRVSRMAPNPTRGISQVHIEVASPQRVSVGVYDVLGRHVAGVFMETVTAAETVAVDVSALPVGVYVVRVEGERGVATRTLVVAR